MEIGEKIKTLRKENNLTQEEFAEKIFVTRTAVSKWELGKGYPSIDSVKIIAEVFGVSVENLISGNDLILLAEKDINKKKVSAITLAFGIGDLLFCLVLFLPLFALRENGFIYSVPLIVLKENPVKLILSYSAVFLTVAAGVYMLIVRRKDNKTQLNLGLIFSLIASAFSVAVFIASAEPYAGLISLPFLCVKAFLTYKIK